MINILRKVQDYFFYKSFFRRIHVKTTVSRKNYLRYLHERMDAFRLSVNSWEGK